MASGQKSGYRFMLVNLPTLNGDCAIKATTMSKSTGTRSFYYSTIDDVIRAAAKNGLFADENNLPLDSQNSVPTYQYPKTADRSASPYTR